MCDRKRITGVIYVRYVVTHLQIRWDHDDPDNPLTIYEELSDERYELRKVEKFADVHPRMGEGGPTGWASVRVS